MADDTLEIPDSRELDIRDQPILARGVPAEGEDPAPWLGAMLRTSAALIATCSPVSSWERTREGLDVVTRYVREELLPEARDRKAPDADAPTEQEAEQYLSVPCPPASEKRERRRWARAMACTVFGIVMWAREMPDDPDGFRLWWAEATRGLDLFSAYVQSEGGPLTWTTR